MAYYITKLTVEVKNPLDNDEEGHTNLLARGGGRLPSVGRRWLYLERGQIELL